VGALASSAFSAVTTGLRNASTDLFIGTYTRVNQAAKVK
jgi:hypothetical protein